MTINDRAGRTALRLRRDQPLIAIPVEENGEEVTYYASDEDMVEGKLAEQTLRGALAVIGAWRDLDWDETVEALDRIRHESKPTPPIDDLFDDM